MEELFEIPTGFDSISSLQQLPCRLLQSGFANPSLVVKSLAILISRHSCPFDCLTQRLGDFEFSESVGPRYNTGVSIEIDTSIAEAERRNTQWAEIEEAMVEASSFFNEYNGRPLEDPRTRLVLDDARAQRNELRGLSAGGELTL